MKIIICVNTEICSYLNNYEFIKQHFPVGPGAIKFKSSHGTAHDDSAYNDYKIINKLLTPLRCRYLLLFFIIIIELSAIKSRQSTKTTI